MSKLLRSISITTSLSAEDAVGVLLELERGQTPSSFADAVTRLATVSVYGEIATRDVAGIKRRLREGLQALAADGIDVAPARIQVKKVPARDWSESWKRHFKPLDLGPRLLARDTAQVIAHPQQLAHQEDRAAFKDARGRGHPRVGEERLELLAGRRAFGGDDPRIARQILKRQVMPPHKRVIPPRKQRQPVVEQHLLHHIADRRGIAEGTHEKINLAAPEARQEKLVGAVDHPDFQERAERPKPRQCLRQKDGSRKRHGTDDDLAHLAALEFGKIRLGLI